MGLSLRRWAAWVILFGLLGRAGYAQEPPPQPDPAVPAAAAPAAPEVPAAAAKRVVILPVDFVVYHLQVGGQEAVPDWSKAAQEALTSAAFEQLGADPRFQVLPMPALPEDVQPLLQEHVALLKVVVGSASVLLQGGGAAWAGKKSQFDYSIGDGLRPLADQWQADYAMLISGTQVTQSGGAAFTQLLVAAGGVALPGGGTTLAASIVDLRTGAVKWLNTAQGIQLFGMTQSDMRKPETASASIAGMFKGFPATTLAVFPAF
jgi:hypothetical protein